MAASLTYHVIRASSPAELAGIFRNLVASSSIEDTTQHLLSGVKQGSVDPGVVGIWLGVTKSPIAIRLALQQDHSNRARRVAIQQFGKNLGRAQWRDTWDGLGGIEGILELFSDLSVYQVAEACRAILRNAKGAEKEAKQDLVCQLFQSFLPEHFPEAPFRNTDKRPLAKYYKQLVCSCPPRTTVDVFLGRMKGGWKEFQSSELLRRHVVEREANLLKPAVLRQIFGKTDEPELDGYSLLPELLTSWPSAPGTEPNLSASMQFSLDLLRRLNGEEHSNFPDWLFVEHLVEPLLRKCKRRKAGWRQFLEIVDLTVNYLSKKPEAASRLTLREERIIHRVARLWSSHPDEFAAPLRELIRLEGSEAHFSSYMFPGIARPKRYALLRICFLAAGKSRGGGDLDSEEDLKHMPFKWSSHVFTWMDVDHGWALFGRLRKHSDIFLSKGTHGIFKQSPSLTADYGDPDIQQLCLLTIRGKEIEAEVLGKQRVDERKNKAGSSSDQGARAFYARGALDFAAASGSLTVYKDTLLWARRFIRDPLTVPELYQQFPQEAKVLLSGGPVGKGPSAVSCLRSRVVEANEILWILLETMLAAIREPSFNLSFWSGALGLFRDVVDHRLKHNSETLKALSLSEDDIYGILWEDTLALLLKVDKTLLLPGHEALGKNEATGVLGRWNDGEEVENALPSTYRFFDELAKGRDQLWHDFRPTVFPAVVSLPAPYPRGLPINTLTSSFLMRASPPETFTPYIASRARAVLFLDPAEALTPYPKDKATRAAIGSFIDSYKAALQVYIPRKMDAAGRKSRVDEVWAHAVGPLSQRRMTSAEAFRYWRSAYGHENVEFWPQSTDSPPDQPKPAEWDPRIPQVEDASEVVEWSPVPPSNDPIEARQLKLTYIDVAKYVGSGPGRIHLINSHAQFPPARAEIPGVQFPQPHFWCTSTNDFSQREARVVSGLLFLDAKNKAQSRILSSPYPSAADVRYPRIYLGGEFLSSGKQGTYTALAMLESHGSFIPPTLLAQLAQNTLDALEDPSLSANAAIEVESIAFELLNILAKSDNPSLASNLAIQTMLRRPDASSWHRRLLAPKFLCRVAANQARSCMSALASAIISAVEEQAKAKKGQEADGREDAKPKTYVKVTTVKYLAQLLNNAEYISQDFNISILQRLAENVTHPDIRAAVLQSLLSMLSATNASTNSKVLAALERFVPIGASLDFRVQMSEEAWLEAERNGEPPEIERHHLQANMPPILNVLIEFISASGRDLSSVPWREEMTSRVILPILSLLQENTTRWMRIFLRKNSRLANGLRVEEFPPVPLNQWVWKRVLESGETFLPRTLLEQYVEWELFNILPPAPLVEFNKSMRKDGKLSTAPACVYFLDLFDNGRAVLQSAYNLERLLAPSFARSLGTNKITAELAQKLLMKQFETVLAAEDTKYAHLFRLTQCLEAPRHPTEAVFESWTVNEKPLVKKMIDYIESKRTNAWQSGPVRRPAVLPDTFHMKLWLLPYPGLPGKGSQEEKCMAFAAELTAILEDVSGGPYHRRFPQIRASVSSRVDDSTDAYLVALCLGSITTKQPTVGEILRIELAESLISGRKFPKDKKLVGKVRGMLKAWLASFDEEVRRIACAFAAQGWKIE